MTGHLTWNILIMWPPGYICCLGYICTHMHPYSYIQAITHSCSNDYIAVQNRVHHKSNIYILVEFLYVVDLNVYTVSVFYVYNARNVGQWNNNLWVLGVQWWPLKFPYLEVLQNVCTASVYISPQTPLNIIWRKFLGGGYHWPSKSAMPYSYVFYTHSCLIPFKACN